MNYSISIYGLFEVSAPTMDELETLIARAKGMREEFASQVIASGAEKGEPNCEEYCRLKGDSRFKCTADEKASGLTREQAAIRRLLAMGVEPKQAGMGEDSAPSKPVMTSVPDIEY